MIDQLLNVLYTALVILGIVAAFSGALVIFWSALYYPVFKRMKLKREEKDLENDELKIQVREARANRLVEELREERDDLMRQKLDISKDLDKLKRDKKKILDAISEEEAQTKADEEVIRSNAEAMKNLSKDQKNGKTVKKSVA